MMTVAPPRSDHCSICCASAGYSPMTGSGRRTSSEVSRLNPSHSPPGTHMPSPSPSQHDSIRNSAYGAHNSSFSSYYNASKLPQASGWVSHGSSNGGRSGPTHVSPWMSQAELSEDLIQLQGTYSNTPLHHPYNISGRSSSDLTTRTSGSTAGIQGVVPHTSSSAAIEMAAAHQQSLKALTKSASAGSSRPAPQKSMSLGDISTRM